MIDFASFEKMGKAYQEKVVSAILQDKMFAEQMVDVLDPKYFGLKYLETVISGYFEYYRKYRTFPSMGLIDAVITKEEEISEMLAGQVREFLSRSIEPLNGDMR